MMEDNLFPLNLQLFTEEEKTEEATPRRKQESRKKGQVAKSSELNASINLLALALLFIFLSDFMFQRALMMVQGFYNDFLSISLKQGQILNLLIRFIGEFFLIMSPIFVTAIIAGIIINFFQVGFKGSSEAIQAKAERLNPLEGFKRILSRKSVVELVKGFIKIFAVSYVSYNYIMGEVESILEILYMGIEASFAQISSLFISLASRVGIIFLILAIIDYVYQRYEFTKSIKMSKYEVKQEHKQMEGDPHLKAKRKEKQRQMSMNRMISEVADSTAVITNPTEIAIALKYRHGEDEAPVVAAKGGGFIAEKIKEIARENDIPIVENKPVAQILYRQGEIGEEIPVELYQAVAEILAMVFRMKK